MYKLTPSDFAYLYQDCKRCYYLKVKQNIVQPSMPMPGIFGAINTRLQGTLIGQDLQTLAPELPPGKVVSQEGFVASAVIPGTQVFLKGKYDLLVKRPDGTYLVVDFKLSQPIGDKVEKYKTQLGAYHYMLTQPAAGPALAISQLGLIIMYPTTVKFNQGQATLTFPPKWLAVPIDEAGFIMFIKGIDQVLAGPLPPVSPRCKWCVYRALKIGEAATEPIQDNLPF